MPTAQSLSAQLAHLFTKAPPCARPSPLARTATAAGQSDILLIVVVIKLAILRYKPCRRRRAALNDR